ILAAVDSTLTYCTSVNPSVFRSSSATYSGATQTVGSRIKRMRVVSGCASATATRGRSPRTAPVPASAVPRNSLRLQRSWLFIAFASGLQFFPQLLPETPVRPLRHDLRGARFDHSDLVQPQGIELQGVFRVQLAPAAIRQLPDGLHGVVVVCREAPGDDGLRDLLRR